MSIMSNIFGFGGNSAPAPAPQAGTPVTPGNIPDTTQQANPANPTVPAVAATTPDTPLQEFATLWESDPKQQGPASLFGNVDPKKLMDAAQKTDFAKAIPKETMAKIQAGGQDGMEAFAAAMNTVSQTVYANSAMATTKIVEQALARQQASFEEKLPGIIKQHQMSDNLRSENPALSNPAVQPFIKVMEQQLAVKHPGATASELTALAKQYVEGIGTLFSPAAKQTPAEVAKAGETDWSKFLD